MVCADDWRGGWAGAVTNRDSRYRAVKAGGLLLDTVQFTSVTEYMHLLKATCQALAPAG